MTIDCLLKKHHYILYTEKYKKISAKTTAELFIQNGWLREKLLISLILNRKL